MSSYEYLVICMDDMCQIFIGPNGPLKIPVMSDTWHAIMLPHFPANTTLRHHDIITLYGKDMCPPLTLTFSLFDLNFDQP